MYRIKRKMDLANGKEYFVIQKKWWIFWFTILEYGDLQYAKQILKEIDN